MILPKPGDFLGSTELVDSELFTTIMPFRDEANEYMTAIRNTAREAMESFL